MRTDWSDAEIDKLKAMWIDGATASQIARALRPNRTRNAVLGKVLRLRLPQRAPKPLSFRPLSKKASQPQSKLLPPPTQVSLETNVPSEDPGPMDPPVTTFTLRDCHCKWPYDTPQGDYHYCGLAPKDGHPWCVYHCGKAYQPQRSKKAAV